MIQGNSKPTETDVKVEWICNECNAPNFTGSVSEEEIEMELHSCINCGCFEFHKHIIKIDKRTEKALKTFN